MTTRRLLLRLALVVPLALLAAGLSAYLVVTLTAPGGEQEVTVPDLKGMEAAAALEAASRQGLAVAVAALAYDPAVPARSVVSQAPEAGRTTRRNRIVRVTLSRGARDLSVPSLAGMSVRRAELTLGQMGLSTGTVAQVHSREMPEGEVLAQTPPAGSFLSRGETVDLLLSAGEAPLVMVMEDLSALPLSEAVAHLRRWGLRAGAVTTEPPPADFPPQLVLSTRPPKGHPVERGQAVDLVVGGV